MKKLFSLVLSLTLCLGASLALADAAPQAVTLDQVPFAYTLVSIEEYVPYTYGIPKDWTPVELEGDDKVFYNGRWQSPDQTATVTTAFEEPGSDTLATRLKKMMGWTSFADVALVTINGRAFISYAEPKAGTTSLVTMLDDGDQDDLMFRYDFTFASPDSDAVLLSQQIASLLLESAEPAAQK